MEEFFETLRKKDLENKIELILTDPPWNLPTSDQNMGTNGEISLETMKALVNQSFKLLSPFGSLVIMCSSRQLSTYINYCSLHFSKVYDFVVIKDKPGYGTQIKYQTFYLVVACKEFARINYESSNTEAKGNSSYPAYVNIIDNYSDPEKPLTSEAGMTLRTYEKNVKFLEMLIARFTRKGPGIIVDPFAGTCSTLRASISRGKDCLCGDSDFFVLEQTIKFLKQNYPSLGFSFHTK